MINGWRHIVGEELAQRFSAVAALNLVVSSQTVNKRLFQNYINRQEALLRDETREQRERLDAGLTEMVAVIGEAKLPPEAVAKAALTLVSSNHQS